jgi:hypothetical protein
MHDRSFGDDVCNTMMKCKLQTTKERNCAFGLKLAGLRLQQNIVVST